MIREFRVTNLSMGFPTNAVAEALFMFDNDTDKALSHLLHRSS